jgi:hypothetical protein
MLSDRGSLLGNVVARRTIGAHIEGLLKRAEAGGRGELTPDGERRTLQERCTDAVRSRMARAVA